ncbi:hypothetical protein EB118_04620 [bacterium]|nr:hypothetical protein [bacterium]NBX97678.1 hypothetical protein [bacterium]NDC94151.1 hypothetical protein [bacterium]NDD83148.1 hypothetical protein [bacterium]NDG29371.1 hypothetical protein [bacterium]
MIIAIKTDVELAEIYIIIESIIVKKQWQAHRQLLKTIHLSINELLMTNGLQLDQLSGVIFFEGPGSFTGLRIGCSVTNALAQSYKTPIVATNGEDWLKKGLKLLSQNKGLPIIQPNYGADIHYNLAMT